ncbi:MAG: hypothetical protein JJE04_13200 [Acidobacteriia bacterium]|nr:hypothetical protein [Terriglobia bacterium]
MRIKRVAILWLGAWLGASLFMGWVSTTGSDSADFVVKSNSVRAQKEVKEIGVHRTRALLQFHMAESIRNRTYDWEAAQLGIGLVLVILLLFGTNGERVSMGLSVLMLVFVGIMHWIMTPQIMELGRGIDFASSEDMIPERQAFWSYFRSYTYMEVLKFVLGVILAVNLLFRSRSGGDKAEKDEKGSRRRRRRIVKVDGVNHADHSHVDG